MTRTKIEFATILAAMRKDGSKPEDLAKEMTIMKLCYEIQKLEDAEVPEPEPESETETPEEDIKEIEIKEEPPKKRKRAIPTRSLWSRITLDESSESDS
jgi:hypothetical protein